jgi:hypothetical protein
VTGLPCPSCGTSRSVISLLRGDFTGAVRINPLGILAAFLLVLFPLWMLADLMLRKPTLVRSYFIIENKMKTRIWIWAPLAIMISANWIWNIIKGL